MNLRRRLVGEIARGLQPLAKRGDPKVEVTFELDANGILSVRAQDKVTGAKAETQIKADKGRLTDEQVEKMIAEAEK